MLVGSAWTGPPSSGSLRLHWLGHLPSLASQARFARSQGLLECYTSVSKSVEYIKVCKEVTNEVKNKVKNKVENEVENEVFHLINEVKNQAKNAVITL